MGLIGVSGKISSGKDTVGRIIQGIIIENKDKTFFQVPKKLDDILGEKHTLSSYIQNYFLPQTFEVCSGFEIKKFAGKLKEIASLMTGIPVEKFEDQEFKETYLGEEWDFADEDASDNIMTVRMFLQRLGTEAVRNGLHENAWVNALFADYKPLYNSETLASASGFKLKTDDIYPNWIITDMRFPNELEAVKKREGITIRVNRPSFRTQETEFGKVSTVIQLEVDKLMGIQEHPSETALDDAEFDYVVENNGSIEELIEKVKQILINEKII
jgi:hypothetical protein